MRWIYMHVISPKPNENNENATDLSCVSFILMKYKSTNVENGSTFYLEPLRKRRHFWTKIYKIDREWELKRNEKGY